MGKKGFKLFGNSDRVPSKAEVITKTVFEWLFNILCLVLVLIALLMAIASIERTKDKDQIGIAALGDITYAPVASNSMEPTIKKGDLAVGRKFNPDKYTLKVGDVITFRTNIDGMQVLNTHRIVEITKEGNLYTQGDNRDVCPTRDDGPIPQSRVVSVWKHNYDGLGKPVIFLQESPKNFFLGVVLPIIILFAIYAFILIRAIVNAALGKKRLEAVTVEGLSEEQKAKLAQEYLASLQAQEDAKAENKEAPVEEPKAAESVAAPVVAPAVVSEEPVVEEPVQPEPVKEENIAEEITNTDAKEAEVKEEEPKATALENNSEDSEKTDIQNETQKEDIKVEEISDKNIEDKAEEVVEEKTVEKESKPKAKKTTTKPVEKETAPKAEKTTTKKSTTKAATSTSSKATKTSTAKKTTTKKNETVKKETVKETKSAKGTDNK